MRSHLFILGVLLFLNATAYGQTDTAYTVMDGDQCSGQNPDGAWSTDETWGSSGGLNLPPLENWSGTKIIIRNNIIICNNDDIDLADSNLDTIIMRQGSSLTYRANSTLILPAGTVLIMEDSVSISVTNQSQGTLLQIGEDSIWGKEILCTVEIFGPRIITNETRICDDNLLPVELASFYATSSNGQIDVDWITASEINTDEFEIHHSNNGIDWVKLTTVDANGGRNEFKFYSWIHKNPTENSNYYKLKQIDNDQSFTWSKIINVQIQFPVSIMHNNPISNFLDISLDFDAQQNESNNINIIITKVDGQTVFNENFVVLQNSKIDQIDLSHLKSGLFFLIINSENETLYSNKLVKME